MLKQEYKIGNKNIIFLFQYKPYYQDYNTIVMGFPYNMNVKIFSKNDVDNVKGYYIYFKLDNECLTVINDIAGNFRTYYMEKENNIYFSDDFLTLFNLLEKSERIPNRFEIEYWNKHRYTTGGNTFVECIKKIKPAHITTITKYGISEESYFKNIKNIPNRQKHFEEVLADMRETVSEIKKMPQKKVLLFSGGADSTLIVKMLQEQNVDFIPVFARVEPTNSMNYDDILKIKYSAEKLGINVKEIVVNRDFVLPENLINIFFTDRFIATMFYQTVMRIKEKYGNDTIIITGQVADSIFGFGATERGCFPFIQRHLLFKPLNIINYFLLEIVKFFRAKYKIYRVPRTIEEYKCGFLDEKAYLPIIDKTKSINYYVRIKNIVDTSERKLKDIKALFMYLKIYGFIQGSDNYGQVQIPESLELKSILFFCTPKIVYSTVQNTDYKYEIFHPKSVVYKVLKDVFNYTLPNIKKVENYKKEWGHKQKYTEYELDIHKCFYDKLNSLEFAEEVHV